MEPNRLVVKMEECLCDWRYRIDSRTRLGESRVLEEGKQIVVIKFRCLCKDTTTTATNITNNDKTPPSNHKSHRPNEEFIEGGEKKSDYSPVELSTHCTCRNDTLVEYCK